MKRQYVALLAALLGMGTGMPAQAQGHRAKQVREYRYVYYPTQQIYYAPEQQIWFWMNSGSWNFGVHLPSRYRGHASTGVPVMLRAERPYVEHVYVEKYYGRPWREKHTHKEKHHRHRHRD